MHTLLKFSLPQDIESINKRSQKLRTFFEKWGYSDYDLIVK
jgi:hypothetical protein